MGNEELEKLKGTNAELASTFESTKNLQMLEVEQQKEGFEKQKEELETKCNNLILENETLKEANAELVSTLESTKNLQTSELEQQKDGFEKQKEELETKCNNLTVENETLKDTIENLRAGQTGENHTLMEKLKTLKQANRELMLSATNVNSLKMEKEELEKENEKLK